MSEFYRLSESEIFGYPLNSKVSHKPNRSGWIRLYCPVHGGDKQLSFALNPETGFFKCFNGNCGVEGYTVESYERWKAEQNKTSRKDPHSLRLVRKSYMKQNAKHIIPQKQEEEFTDRTDLAAKYQALLTPDSLAARYLASRGIPFELAKQYGLGFCPPGDWLFGKDNAWMYGRVVVPHEHPDGRIVNLYGRAIGEKNKLPKHLRDVFDDKKHMHKRGLKGIFNVKALEEDTVYICEGAFDALSLIAAGYPNACAIFGVNGLRWDWVKANTLVFCLDNDTAGQESWRELAKEAVLLGKKVYFLDESTYQGYKDLNEVWVATGHIDLGEIREEAPQNKQQTNEEEPQATWDDYMHFVAEIEAQYAHLKVFAEKHPELNEPFQEVAACVEKAIKARNTKLLMKHLEELMSVYVTIQQVYDAVK